jgi:MYXO-CTERM domain-containing protein
LENCQEGLCAISECEDFFGDCDQQTGTGCETSFVNDPNHCGQCDKKCELANAQAACTDGDCVIEQCLQGFADCNLKDSDGCEFEVSADPDNCGGCGHSCNAAHATSLCLNSQCVIESCEDGFGDCDQQASTGCEEYLLESLEHCGGCGQACELAKATSQCLSGSCGITACDDGFANCNRDHADGCEVDLQDDDQNCGACGAACLEGKSCQQGQCLSCADQDQDGHGVMPCGDDCDDQEPTVYGGADEICQDHLDNNCNGLTDEDCQDDFGHTGGGGCGCTTESPADARWWLLLGFIGWWLRRKK